MTKLLFFPTLSLLAPCAGPDVSRAVYLDRRKAATALSVEEREKAAYIIRRAAQCIGAEMRVNRFQATSARFSERPWSTELASLDDALNALAERAARKAHVVELRFFGGLSVEETAVVLHVSSITVMREWNTKPGSIAS